MVLRPNREYANKFNKQFDDKKSHFVTLNERINQQFSKVDIFVVQSALNEFKRRHPEHTKFSDLTDALCQSIYTTLDKIKIDDTMQRRANPGHISGIIAGWVNSRLAPIQVYEDPNNPGTYISWDGQHTVLSLRLIASEFNADLSKCVVPINVYKFKDRIEIRENFIRLATVGDKKQAGSDKLPLYPCELFYQQVRAVRVDGYTDNIRYNQTEEKYRYIQEAECFVTHNEYGDAHQPGAITRLTEINKFDPIITKWLCQYFNTINQDRAVSSNEIALIANYLNMCKEQGINITDYYIDRLANITLQLFNANFDSKSASNTFWDKCKAAYNNWHIHNPEKTGNPKMGITTENGLSFLIPQLEKTAAGSIKVPAFEGKFNPFDSDLV